jgi:hypothetical protein
VNRARLIAGCLILFFQLVMVGYARFTPARYFCWAPFDIQSEYSLHVLVDNRPLTEAEVYHRYRRAKNGYDSRSIQHLIDIVQQYEQTYGRQDHARIVMKYRVNGKLAQEWRYP